MTAIAIVDTSVLCEVLQVPGKSQAPEQILASMRHKIEAGERLFLPLTALIETGNHIGQVSDGRARRRLAEQLRDIVSSVLAGTMPFSPMRLWDRDDLTAWLPEFPDWASHGSGLGDLTLKKEWERMCARNGGRRVYIWSTDAHLAAFDRGPAL